MVFSAATARAATPEQTVEEYIAKAKVDGLAVLPDLLHPEALRSFRAWVEPIIVVSLKNRRLRAAFDSFSDPYNLGKMRAFSSDGEFLAVFVRWLRTRQPQAVELYKNVEVTVLGHVDDGPRQHVIVRTRMTVSGAPLDLFEVISTQAHEGKLKLMLTPELRRTVEALTGSQQ